MIETTERPADRVIFQSLHIRDVRSEAGDSILVTFDVPEEARGHFAFAPGQHLTLRRTFDGEELRRSYSICTAPSEGSLRVAIRRVPDGRFSNWAIDNLEAGDTLDVMTPIGHFAVPPADAALRDVAFIAAGSGITPIISQLRHLLESEPGARATLLYLNRTSDSTMFVEELLALKNRYLNRCTIFFQNSREEADGSLFTGRLTAEALGMLLADDVLPRDADAWMMCGPQEMLDMIRTALIGAGVAAPRIHSELFGLSAGSVATPPAGLGDAQATVRFNGRSSVVTVAAGHNILDAARRSRSDLPFACKTGVCSTCRCKVVKGKVDMAANFALNPDEVEQGFVLSCQSYPKTDHVELDFDA